MGTANLALRRQDWGMIFASYLERPRLGAVQNTQRPNPVGHHRVGCNVWCARDNEFACSGYTARTSAFMKVEEATRNAALFSST